jgi:flagellar basal-body rod modification protein FlgD
MTVASATSTTATTASDSANSASSVTTLTSLAGNFNDFLTLLTTQLQNQDPTSPMDTNQFTSQLVQFTQVAEQINTNTTLGQLLNSSLSQQLTQATSLVGQKVSFSGGTLPLQNSSATVDFQVTSAQPVQVVVSDSSGNEVRSQTVNAASGSNTWTWNGTNDNGAQLPDGSYNVAVTAGGSAVPFQAVGTVTGAEQSGQAVQLQFGGASTAFSNVVSLSGAAATTTSN